ncbi:MAG: 23S rRNA (uridine(2552)-2'-O)-methyltransferase RlmE [Gammaproteobacteria bacterium]|nr:23S rRNA (uridine(2552)-2'-O)-methyltransferase RlmE [Gammaproteobacteria bacterium]MDE2023470.1 23S rRNA (uridine(2552)-2'-O)-methyltransferase RlmE [Gammaproteobacteria bacterium]
MSASSKSSRCVTSKRTPSSARWLAEHFSDAYVKRAHAQGWRSRAAFKLEEIQRRDHLIKPGMTIVDLGAAPGGWSQYAAGVMAGRGLLLAVDILPLAPLAGVEFLQGDFTEAAVLASLHERLAGRTLDLVLSDLAPNITGEQDVDQARAMLLAEQALEFARPLLAARGALLVKLFQGAGFAAFLQELRRGFDSVATRKPGASRARSRELYLLAQRPRSGVV